MRTRVNWRWLAFRWQQRHCPHEWMSGDRKGSKACSRCGVWQMAACLLLSGVTANGATAAASGGLLDGYGNPRGSIGCRDRSGWGDLPQPTPEFRERFGTWEAWAAGRDLFIAASLEV